MLPGVTARHAHGQMRAHELESIMSDFYHQRFQILIATTIIESGIDVSTANTILINRADKLGLAQLHQLRGRVGRSHHRAYAYLIAPPKSALTPDAVKRLEAIESLEELGVGFTLATHDLEIRDAGELLGEGQSGQIQEIGFNLYNDLLERAVKFLKAAADGDVGANDYSPLQCRRTTALHRIHPQPLPCQTSHQNCWETQNQLEQYATLRLMARPRRNGRPRRLRPPPEEVTFLILVDTDVLIWVSNRVGIRAGIGDGKCQTL